MFRQASEFVRIESLVKPDALAAGATTASDIDISQFERGLLILDLGVAGGTSTVDLVVQHADAAGGSYATIFTATQMAVADDETLYYLDLDLTNPNIKRYLQVTLTIGTAAADAAVSLLLTTARTEPVSQPADVSALTGTWAAGILVA
jgi:hypothetical protein